LQEFVKRSGGAGQYRHGLTGEAARKIERYLEAHQRGVPEGIGHAVDEPLRQRTAAYEMGEVERAVEQALRSEQQIYSQSHQKHQRAGYISVYV